MLEKGRLPDNHNLQRIRLVKFQESLLDLLRPDLLLATSSVSNACAIDLNK